MMRLHPRRPSRLALALFLAAPGLWPAPLLAQSPVTRYEYDANGNRSAVIDPLNRRTGNAWDALNRLSRTTDAVGGVVAYGYDALDRLTRVTDPRNLATTYTYNGLGDLLRLASPDSGTTQQTYDAAGNLLTRTDAKNQTTSYQYDALNRIARIAYADAQITLYTYDQGINGVGRLTGIAHTYPAGHPFAGQLILAFTYDAHGRLLAEAQTLPGGATARVAWAYDAAGRLATLTYPSGRQVSHAYDALGRVSELRVSAGGQSQTVATGIAYRPFGPAAAHVWGSGKPHTLDFDAEGRQSGYPAGGSRTRLAYDAASNIVAKTDVANPALAYAFAYDALDRLTAQTEAGLARAWSYDAVGNRLSQRAGGVTTAYQYGAASNRLTRIGSRAVTSDANGAITADGAHTFTYDARGRLLTSQGAGGTLHHLIDPLGRRLMKRDAQGGTQFAYDAAGHLIAEHDALSGAARLEHLWANDAPLAVAEPQPGGVAELILDNGSAAFSVRGTGTWPVSTAVAGYHGANYQTHAGARIPGGDGTFDTAVWKPATTGSYDVYARWTADANRASNARYTIFHRDGQDTVTVDQRQHGASWVRLGSYAFTGSSHRVELSSQADGYVVADAIRLLATQSNQPAPVHYVHSDHLGTPRLVVSGAGSVLWHWSGEAFGATLANEDADGNSIRLAYNLRFPGQYFDRETNTHYNYFRDYDPGTGRYVQEDPIGLAGGINGYAYVGNAPTMYTDPLGLQKSGGLGSLLRGIGNLFRTSHATDPNIPPGLGGPQPYVPIPQQASTDPRLDPQYEPRHVCISYSCPMPQPAKQCTPANPGGDPTRWIGGPFISAPGWSPKNSGCVCTGYGWSYAKQY